MLRWPFRKTLAVTAAGLVALCIAAYAADWLVLQLRARHGTVFDSVMVDSVDVVQEKGSRVEYYYNPPQPTPCVHTLFPHEGLPACWWLLRHNNQQRFVN